MGNSEKIKPSISNFGENDFFFPIFLWNLVTCKSEFVLTTFCTDNILHVNLQRCPTYRSLQRLTTGKNETEYSWHVTAIKFIGMKKLVYKVAKILEKLRYLSGADPEYVKRGGRDPKRGGPGGWYNPKIAPK